jgi:hypothetical protein
MTNCRECKHYNAKDNTCGLTGKDLFNWLTFGTCKAFEEKECQSK